MDPHGRTTPPTLRARVRAFLARDTSGTLALCVAVGLLAAVGAVALRWGIEAVQVLVFRSHDPTTAAAGLPWWVVVFAPAAGALLVGLLVHFVSSESKGHGVPEIMRAVQLEGGRIRGRVALVKAAASALMIGSGGSCGREGPIAQIGASLGSFVARQAGAPAARTRVLTAAGAGAGIAATFNAPIAGAFFALEVILGNFAMECFGPIVVASVVATVAGRAVLGPDATLTHGGGHGLVHPLELVPYALLGVVAAGVGVAFGRALVHAEEAFERVPLPGWFKPTIGGLAVGGIAWGYMPAVLGNGDAVVGGLLAWTVDQTVPALLALLVLKLVATSLTLGSGGSGGVFFPSLFLGAVLGAIVGKLAGVVLPVETASPGAYALVGMAAVAAAAAHAPITMSIMVFELTNDYKIIAPLLLAASVSAIVAKGLQRESIYTLRLARRGVRLDRGLEAMIMHDLRVEDVMRSHECETVRPSTPLAVVLNRFLDVRTDTIYVVADDGRFLGMIPLQEVKSQIKEAPTALESQLIIAQDVLRADVPTLSAGDPLTRALDLLQQSDLRELPVLRPAVGGAPARFVGTLSEHDVLGAYNQEVLRKEVLLARFVSRRRDDVADDGEALKTDYFELPPGYALAQVPIPPAFHGRCLRDLQVRQGFGLNVLAIKAKSADGWEKLMPDPNRTLDPNDLLVVMGPEQGITALQSGGSSAPSAS